MTVGSPSRLIKISVRGEPWPAAALKARTPSSSAHDPECACRFRARWSAQPHEFNRPTRSGQRTMCSCRGPCETLLGFFVTSGPWQNQGRRRARVTEQARIWRAGKRACARTRAGAFANRRRPEFEKSSGARWRCAAPALAAVGRSPWAGSLGTLQAARSFRARLATRPSPRQIPASIAHARASPEPAQRPNSDGVKVPIPQRTKMLRSRGLEPPDTVP